MKRGNISKCRFEDVGFKKFIVIFIPVFASSVLAIAFALSVFINPDQRDVDGSLGIISLAVAVWTGINIANVIEKNEVEKIRRKLIFAEAKIKQSKEFLEQSKKIIDDLNDNKKMHEEIERKEFLYILESADDAFYRYLSDLYKEDEKDRQVVPSELNAETLRIIKGILHIRSLHEINKYDMKEHIFDYSSELIERINEIDKDIPACLTKQVLHFIKAEAYFYSAFAKYKFEEDNRKYITVASHFHEAAKEYEDLLHFFLVKAPEKQVHDIIESYYYNTVAQCYSEILYCLEQTSKDASITKEILSFVNVDKACEKTLSCTEKATSGRELPSYPFSYERYYKNSGVARERVAKVSGKDYIMHLKDAIRDYEIAEKYGTQSKTGYVLCSAYNKYIRELIRPNEMDFITPKCEESLWEKGTIDDKDKDDFIKACNRLRGVSNKWRQINPSESLFFALNILSQLYEGLIVDDDQKSIILNRVRLDVDEIKLIPPVRQSGINKVVINVFDRIYEAFSNCGEDIQEE